MSNLKSEVAEILDELMLDVLQEVSKKYGIEIYSQTFPDERATQILQLLKDKLLERAEQQQILVGWKKDMNHTPIHQDWQAIPVSEVHKLLGDGND